MSKNKIVVLATSSHPLFEKLKELPFKFYDVEKDEPFEERRSNYLEAEAIFDFTLFPKDKKYVFLKNLSIQFEVPIVSELSCYWGDFLIKQVPLLQGSFSTVFCGAGPKFEYTSANEEIDQLIQIFFEHLKLKGLKVATPGLGFTFPRTLVQIINEAYFALEEGVASKEDIDRAMKFGVNYPKGPFEWCDEIGADKVCMLLDELYYFTKGPRYRASSALRLQAGLL
jgi:3-hydroxybutyryl-CoA dehydrogenase